MEENNLIYNRIPFLLKEETNNERILTFFQKIKDERFFLKETNLLPAKKVLDVYSVRNKLDFQNGKFNNLLVSLSKINSSTKVFSSIIIFKDISFISFQSFDNKLLDFIVEENLNHDKLFRLIKIYKVKGFSYFYREYDNGSFIKEISNRFE